MQKNYCSGLRVHSSPLPRAVASGGGGRCGCGCDIPQKISVGIRASDGKSKVL